MGNKILSFWAKEDFFRHTRCRQGFGCLSLVPLSRFMAPPSRAVIHMGEQQPGTRIKASHQSSGRSCTHTWAVFCPGHHESEYKRDFFFFLLSRKTLNSKYILWGNREGSQEETTGRARAQRLEFWHFIPRLAGVSAPAWPGAAPGRNEESQWWVPFTLHTEQKLGTETQ